MTIRNLKIAAVAALALTGFAVLPAAAQSNYYGGYYSVGYDAPYAYGGYEMAPVVRYSYRGHSGNPYSQTRQPRDPRNSASSGGNGYTFN
jgi:hypothetical protein